jgi:hypothetical protein
MNLLEADDETGRALFTTEFRPAGLDSLIVTVQPSITSCGTLSPKHFHRPVKLAVSHNWVEVLVAEKQPNYRGGICVRSINEYQMEYHQMIG